MGSTASSGDAAKGATARRARKQPPSLASTKPFVVLLSLLAATLSVQFLVVGWHHRRHDRRVLGTARGDDDGDDGGGGDDDDRDDDPAEPARASLTSSQRVAVGRIRNASLTIGLEYVPLADADRAAAENPTTAHLAPHVPPWPPFFVAEGPNGVPDAEKLVADVYSGERPTIMGTWLILTRFVRAMKESNDEMAARWDEGGGGHPRRRRPPEAEEVHARFVSLAQKHLLPLDEAYRGRAIFPIRDDDSIFVSLASFRDHLLGDTLKGMFDQAAHPEKLFVGVVVQNCFGLNPYPGEPGVQCRTGAQVVGKVNGRDQTKVSDAPPDRNGIEEFCMSSEKHREICNSGRIRALYVHENESLGPVVARYYASKLWGGESYYVQFDAHIHFYKGWDELYVHELKSAKSFPKAMLSSYPPGFKEDGEDNGGILGGDGGHGTLLCSCKFSPSNVESHIIRINIAGRYTEDVERPAQIPFVAAGFFFAPASFLVDVPFDPYMPWCFMGEEIMLSMRAYTHGWDVYAPRKNWIAHQYRPGRMGLPKFWGSVGRLFGQPGPGINTQLQRRAIKRAKYLVGYDEEDEDCCAREQLIEDGLELVLTDVEHYGFGEARTREAFLEWANIDVDAQECHPIKWCGDGKMRPISA